MFNFSGSEIVFLLLLALIVLGPEKLPDALRKFGKGYAEFKKVTTGFQEELKSALDEPMREMRETAEAFRQAATFELDPHAPTPQSGSSAARPAADARSNRVSAAADRVAPAPMPTSDAGATAETASTPGTASPHGDDLGASAG